MSADSHIRIGTRGSDLALWQANFVKAQLEALGCEVKINIIKTRGDQIQNLSFEKLEGKGFFTKEIEDALLEKSVDLAIHSLKDLETADVPGLEISAVSYREDPSDCLLIQKGKSDATQHLSLGTNAVVGTSSARRKAQLIGFRPDIQLKDLRGNVPTRINKLREGKYDAIMLATAGLNRLEIDLSEFDVVYLDPKEFIPAPAQGVLGLQTRADDQRVKRIVEQLNDPAVRERIKIERRVLQMYSGGCQLPLGVYCEKHDDKFTVYGALGRENKALSRAVVNTSDGSEAAQLLLDELKKKELN